MTSLVLVHARASLRELARYPTFSVPTLAFPALFFLLFAASRARSHPDLYLASFCGFAVLAVALFQFGVGIALERESPWELYVRTLPVSIRARFAARLVSATCFALAAAAIVAATAVLVTPANLQPLHWLELGLVLLAGAVPYALLGIAVGYLATPRGALPIANVLYLLLSFSAGLWTTAARLPASVRAVSPFVPTRPYAELLARATTGDVWVARPWLLLAAWGGVFGLVAARAYRRDETRRWR